MEKKVDLTPKQIVEKLDQYIIGQEKAKRAVAVALRNRTRRLKLDESIRDEVAPKNILMIGPSASPNYSLKDGIVPDDNMGDAISVTVIATGFNNSAVSGNETEELSEPQAEPASVDSNVLSPDEFSSILGGNASSSTYTDTPSLFDSNEEKIVEKQNVPLTAQGTFRPVGRTGEQIQHSPAKSDDLSVPAYLRNRTINLKRK